MAAALGRSTGLSQAQQRRAAALRVLGVALGDARQQRRARQPPELGRGQLLPGGRELPAHVAPADPALGYGPGVPARAQQSLGQGKGAWKMPQ